MPTGALAEEAQSEQSALLVGALQERLRAWREPVELAELEAVGVSVVPYSGPRFALPSWRWLLVAASLVVGTFAIRARAEARGRDWSYWWPVAICVVIAGVFAWLHIRQVRSLRHQAGSTSRYLGWTLTAFDAAELLEQTSPSIRQPLATAAVGVFLSKSGLRLHLDVGSGRRRTVESNERVQIAIGHRGKARWLIVTIGDSQMSRRLHRPLRA